MGMGRMTYAWWGERPKRPQHIIDDSGKSLCQLENIKRRKKFRPFTGQSETPSPDLQVCANCLAISQAREPSLSVLMGERVA